MKKRRSKKWHHKPVRWLGSHFIEILTAILLAASIFYYVGASKAMRTIESSSTEAKSGDASQ